MVMASTSPYSTPLFFLFSLILTNFIPTIISQPNFILKSCQSESGNYTTNSIYKANLDSLLSSISSNTQIDYGFYNFSAGEETNKVNAVALCRGDVKLDKCRSCVNDSTYELLQICPNQKEAVGWYDDCMLRYSNKSIFGVRDNSMELALYNVENASDISGFNTALRSLLSNLISNASSGSSTLKFATGETDAPNFQTIYGLVQCTPDLSRLDCSDCLDQAAEFIPGCCGGKVGGRVVTPTCNLRYEVYRFYDPSTPPSPPPSPVPDTATPPTKGKNSNTTTIAIAIAVPTVSLVLLFLIICFLCSRKKKKQKSHNQLWQTVESEASEEISTSESLQFDFETIKAATNDFHNENKLGQGGFGAVYKGRLPNGKYIAVKRLAANSGQGDLEFKNEVLLVAKLQHRNLVRLLGFCLERSERLLIYEFVPNASLDHFLFDPMKRTLLNWERRYKIIGGVARGLLYLHEDSRLRIIHRDMKASNVLLDTNMIPKISDFGMARLFVMDETQGNTNRIVGTYGYMAPEYAMYGQFSIKSDVFSFGVLILEIVSGQKNNYFRNGDSVEDLLSFAWRNWQEGTVSNLIDPTLSTGSRNEMMRCIHIGLLCVQENVGDRPTMASIVLMLNSSSLILPVPQEPAFFMHSNTIDESSKLDQSSDTVSHSSQHSRSKPHQASQNEASITDPYPR